MAHVVPHAASPPLREQIGSAALHRDEQVREGAHRLGRGDLGDLAVRPPYPDAIADRELDLALPFHGLLDALALRKLEQHPLLASRRPTLPVGVVQGQVLVDDEITDPDVRGPGDEGFDGGAGVLTRRGRCAHTDHGQQEREDEGAPHGCGYNAVDVLNAN